MVANDFGQGLSSSVPQTLPQLLPLRLPCPKNPSLSSPLLCYYQGMSVLNFSISIFSHFAPFRILSDPFSLKLYHDHPPTVRNLETRFLTPLYGWQNFSTRCRTHG